MTIAASKRFCEASSRRCEAMLTSEPFSSVLKTSIVLGGGDTTFMRLIRQRK